MTTGTATTQNYLLSNDFSPGNGGGTYGTVGSGNAITSTCNTGNFTNDLCSGTTKKGCSEASGSGGFVSSCPAIAVNARGGTWDSGAFQATGTAIAPSCSPSTPYTGPATTDSITDPNTGTHVTCFTTNGTTPATAGNGTSCTTGSVYTTPIAINSTLTVNAIAGDEHLTRQHCSFLLVHDYCANQQRSDEQCGKDIEWGGASVRFDLVDGAYRSESVTADCQVCMNWYVEMIESSMGKSAKALYDRPGLRLIYQLGSSPCRGEITAQGRTFTVEGATLCALELFPPKAATPAVARGAIASDGQPVSMAYGPTQVMIVSAGHLYCYQFVANSNAPTQFPANSLTEILPFTSATNVGLLGTPKRVQYADGFFVLHIVTSDGIAQLQCSAI